jgi:hypothetical protein
MPKLRTGSCTTFGFTALKATAALVSPETESLLAAGLMPDAAGLNPYFAGDSDFTQYNRWLATRKRLEPGLRS